MSASDLAIGTDAVPSKGTTSPVAWSVYQRENNLVVWKDTTLSIYSLFPTVTISWRLPTAKSQVTRVTYKYKQPVDRPTVDSASNTTHKVIGNIQYLLEVIVPQESTASERSAALRIFIQSLLDAQMLNALKANYYPN